jgi:hypothetical protein
MKREDKEGWERPLKSKADQCVCVRVCVCFYQHDDWSQGRTKPQRQHQRQKREA